MAGDDDEDNSEDLTTAELLEWEANFVEEEHDRLVAETHASANDVLSNLEDIMDSLDKLLSKLSELDLGDVE